MDEKTTTISVPKIMNSLWIKTRNKSFSNFSLVICDLFTKYSQTNRMRNVNSLIFQLVNDLISRFKMWRVNKANDEIYLYSIKHTIIRFIPPKSTEMRSYNIMHSCCLIGFRFKIRILIIYMIQAFAILQQVKLTNIIGVSEHYVNRLKKNSWFFLLFPGQPYSFLPPGPSAAAVPQPEVLSKGEVFHAQVSFLPFSFYGSSSS